MICVSQSQLADNSNSSEGGGKDDSEYSGEERGEIEDSVVREKGKDEDRGERHRQNGKEEEEGEGQGTLSVSSVRKYQRAATRPPPGTVKSLMAKFQ